MDEVKAHDCDLAQLAKTGGAPTSRVAIMVAVYDYGKGRGLSLPEIRRFVTLSKALTLAQVKEHIDKYVAGIPVEEADVNEWEAL